LSLSASSSALLAGRTGAGATRRLGAVQVALVAGETERASLDDKVVRVVERAPARLADEAAHVPHTAQRLHAALADEADRLGTGLTLRHG